LGIWAADTGYYQRRIKVAQVPLSAVIHVRNSSRLNANLLRELADERNDAAIKERAEQIDKFADELDRDIKAREAKGE
jgi:hypothetical protein